MCKYIHQVYEPAGVSAVLMKSASHEQGANSSEQRIIRDHVQSLASNHEAFCLTTTIFFVTLASLHYFGHAGFNHAALALLTLMSGSVFNLVLIEFQRISAEYNKLVEDFKRLSEAYDTVSAAKSKLVIEIEALRHDKVELKISNLSKSISPQTIAFNSSSFDQPLCVFHANAEEEKDKEYEGKETDDDYDGHSDDYSVDSAFYDNQVGYKEEEYLTFYVGNIHYGASFYHVGKAFETKSGVGTVDQVVIARTSEGESRGCAFVTIRWNEYVRRVYKSQNQNSDTHTRSYDAYLRSALCDDFAQTRICGRRAFVEVARNQRRN